MNKFWQADNEDLASLVVQSRKRSLAGETRLFCDKFSVNLVARKSAEGEERNLAKIYSGPSGFYVSYFIENDLHMEGPISAEDLVLDGLEVIAKWWDSQGFPKSDDTENLVEIIETQWAHFSSETSNDKAYSLDQYTNNILIGKLRENSNKYQRICSYVGEEDAVWEGKAVYDLRVSEELLGLVARENQLKGQYQPVLIERTESNGKNHFLLIHAIEKLNGWKTIGKNMYRTPPVYQEVSNKGKTDVYINTAQCNYDESTRVQSAPVQLLNQIGPVVNEMSPSVSATTNPILDPYARWGLSGEPSNVKRY